MTELEAKEKIAHINLTSETKRLQIKANKDLSPKQRLILNLANERVLRESIAAIELSRFATIRSQRTR